MERTWIRSPVICLRLIHDQIIYHHCSLCTFLQEGNIKCHHEPAQTKQPIHRTTTPLSTISDCSFYTAPTDVSTDHNPDLHDVHGDNLSLSSNSSSQTIRANSPTNASTHTNPPPSLRRSISPTKCSLRELNSAHAQRARIRQQFSEDRLRRVYESQITAYLNSGPPALASVAT